MCVVVYIQPCQQLLMLSWNNDILHPSLNGCVLRAADAVGTVSFEITRGVSIIIMFKLNDWLTNYLYITLVIVVSYVDVEAWL